MKILVQYFLLKNLLGYLTDYLTPNEYLYFTSGMQYIDELPNKFQQFLIKNSKPI